MATGAKGASSLEGVWHSAPNTDKNLQHRPKSQPAQALQLARVSRRPLLVWVWNKGLGRGPVFLHSCLIRRSMEGGLEGQVASLVSFRAWWEGTAPRADVHCLSLGRLMAP